MKCIFSKIPQQGFTLIELMIVVAIIAILGGIAIPAYNQYIEDSAVSATKFNLESMRLSVEDYRLDYDDYPPAGNYTNAAIDAQIGWDPGGMGVKYNYTLVSAPVAGGAVGGFTIYATNLTTLDNDGNQIWVRCENRGRDCCYSVTPGAGADPAAACP